ncbi:MAG TPA: helix-turn-helix transcriptional regulator [Pyrinomonadaceae bacterium]|nr:helix-turn-helix transcriptional regulator [Pyrinomonadaceae bacterium]
MKYLQTGQFFGETDQTFLLDGITLTDTEYTIEKVDWHYHENPYFTFIVRGNLIEGNKQNTHHCSTGTLLFHNWQEAHFNLKPEGYTRGFQLEMKADWFAEFDLDLNFFPSYSNVANPSIKLFFHNIYKETKLFGKHSSLAVEELLLNIFGELGKLKKFDETKKPLWVKKIDEIFRANISEEISLQKISQELNLHPIYLCRTFSKFFGCNFGQYLRKIKVEKSLKLLQNNSLSLTEISFASGFSDQSHFIRCFKEFMKLTPKEYRKFVSNS